MTGETQTTGWTRGTRKSKATIVTGVTRVTRVTEVTRVTGKTNVTGLTRVIRMLERARVIKVIRGTGGTKVRGHHKSERISKWHDWVRSYFYVQKGVGKGVYFESRLSYHMQGPSPTGLPSIFFVV